MAMGDVRHITVYTRTEWSSLQLGLRVGGHMALTDFHSDDVKWNLPYGWRRIDSTINIVVIIIIIIIIIVIITIFIILAAWLSGLNVGL